MPILSKPSAEARVAIAYVTGGALLNVWSGIWYLYMRNNPPQTEVKHYVCYGLFLTGVVLVVIGFALGRIGRAARQAELPPPDGMSASALVDNAAVLRTPVAPASAPVVQPLAPTGAAAVQAPANAVVPPASLSR